MNTRLPRESVANAKSDSKDGRTLKRHLKQEELNTTLRYATSQQAKSDMKTRKHLSERSLAHSTRYGHKRARWRRLWRVEIQDFLIAAIQNITVLIAHPQNTMSKSSVQIERIGIYLKGQDDAIRSLLVKAFGIFQALLDFA